MSSTSTKTATKPVKPKKVVMSTGRGGGGNFRKVETKKYVTETKGSASTNKRMLEIELPRNVKAYSGRGGAGNSYTHVLEDGVFERVITYELGKVKANQGEREEKRRSAARTRTYSTSKPNKTPTLASDDSTSISPSHSGISFRQSWASRSTVDVSAHPARPSDTRKSLRETLLAPLRTTFTRRPHSFSSTIKDDTSSFSACSGRSILEGPVSPIEPPTSPASHTSDETYSAITPSTAEIFGELAGRPVPRRRSTGAHRSPRNSSRLAPPMPSPMTPLPPIPTLTVNEGRSSLPVPLPAMPNYPPPVPQPNAIRSRIAAIQVKSLQATPAPLQTQMQASTSYSSSASSSQDRLSVTAPRLRSVASVNMRAPNRKMYNASVAARSMGHLPVPFDPREASFYDGSDVDRVDPFIAQLTRDGDKSFESLLPWINAPNSALSSVSSISIPSFNDSRPELVAA